MDHAYADSVSFWFFVLSLASIVIFFVALKIRLVILAADGKFKLEEAFNEYKFRKNEKEATRELQNKFFDRLQSVKNSHIVLSAIYNNLAFAFEAVEVLFEEEYDTRIYLLNSMREKLDNVFKIAADCEKVIWKISPTLDSSQLKNKKASIEIYIKTTIGILASVDKDLLNYKECFGMKVFPLN